MKKTKGFIAEFKEFIQRGNVMDMAVGIIVGSAFTAIVTSLVNDMLMPIIGMILKGINIAGLSVQIGSATLKYGNFIQTIINFLLISLCVFIMIRMLSKLSRKKEEEEEAAPAPDENIVLLTEIRDLLADQKKDIKEDK
jgi:large conductance mechanosensitive channel